MSVATADAVASKICNFRRCWRVGDIVRIQKYFKRINGENRSYLMENSMVKQKQLIEFYERKFANADLSLDYSSPHLMSLDSGVINTDIMFVGQETNSWYGSWKDFKDRGVQGQMMIYDRFMKNEYGGMNKPFWKYIKEIIGSEDIRPVWTNLFKFDLGDSRKPENNISHASGEELEFIRTFHKGILAKEIEIIQPKIIIFFTGHKYDNLFFDPIVKKENGDYRLLYNQINELDGIDEWKCADMGLKYFEGFENFEGNAIRTYHPMYLNRTNNTFRASIKNYLRFETQSIMN